METHYRFPAMLKRTVLHGHESCYGLVEKLESVVPTFSNLKELLGGKSLKRTLIIVCSYLRE